MKNQVPLTELHDRLKRFRTRMDKACPDWEMAVIFSKINLYYFTGTMQDGMLLIPRQDAATFWVRRSFERAVDESLFPSIKPMQSFRDARPATGTIPATVYLEMEEVPLALYQRFNKHFPFAQARPLDLQVSAVRMVKSPYELARMEQAGRIHQRILEDLLPPMLREGISEAELAADLYPLMIREGHHGVNRFGMFDTEIAVGHISFGESSLYPTYFNGAGGNYGLCPAVPLLGSRERKLAKGDLVYIDMGCGVEGYHTDKTMTYMFSQPLPDEVIAIHQQCYALHQEIASQLKPGAIPSQIFRSAWQQLSPEFLKNFMGYGSRQVKFLGHGIGLVVDELPVIAEGFDDPLHEGMTLAIEPKKGIEKIGMVGIENTFLVTPQGGRNLTGDNPGLIRVEA